MVSCGLLNFASCLPQKFFEYIVGILSSPYEPLLNMIKDLLSAQVELDIFTRFWIIIIYIISMFYSILILYSGFQFIISGSDVVKRENAKEWLKNIVIMIILIQASFFIYELFVQLSSVLTSSTIDLMGENLFKSDTSGIVGIALEIIFFIFGIGVLIITAIFLIIRYVIVAVGVVLFPIGIFFYYVPFLRQYGLLILNFLGIAMFINFIDAIILIGFSMILDIALFSNLKIFVIISAFLCIDILMFFMMFFSIIKSALSLGTKVIAIGAKAGAIAG